MTHRMSEKDLIIPLVISGHKGFNCGWRWHSNMNSFTAVHVFLNGMLYRNVLQYGLKNGFAKYSHVEVLQQCMNAYFHRPTTARVPPVPGLRVICSSFSHKSWNSSISFGKVKHLVPILLQKYTHGFQISEDTQ